MIRDLLDIVILGLSITSSWGNGHATLYRGLAAAAARRGHRLTFLEREMPWYASNRDLPRPGYCRTELYGSLEELDDRFAGHVRNADVVLVGSYVPEGIAVGTWVIATAGGLTGFYDIDTPITLAAVDRDECHYLSRQLIPQYGLYLSFAGGRSLDLLTHRYGSPMALQFPCCVDPEVYSPLEGSSPRWDLGYLGTYSEDRQPGLARLLLEPAVQWPEGRFVIAGPQYPDGIRWPPSVERVEHLPPGSHRDFYVSQRFTLNITRREMARVGHAPSVRLFEAAGCGTPVISDWSLGLDSFFAPGREILISASPGDTLRHLRQLGDDERHKIAAAARRRVLAEHTTDHRIEQLEEYVRKAFGRAPALK